MTMKDRKMVEDLIRTGYEESYDSMPKFHDGTYDGLSVDGLKEKLQAVIPDDLQQAVDHRTEAIMDYWSTMSRYFYDKGLMQGLILSDLPRMKTYEIYGIFTRDLMKVIVHANKGLKKRNKK